jgi:folate-binding protein YgfZ
MNQHDPQRPHQAGQPGSDAPFTPVGGPIGYADLRRSLAWGDLGRRSVLTVRGPDAVRFIDNFTTAAVSALAAGAGTEGFFADARGWVLALTNILRSEDGVWIDAPAGLAAGLREHLDRYHIREKFELKDESDTYRHLVVAGPEAEAWLAARSSVRPPETLLQHCRGLLGTIPVAIVRVDWYGPVGFLVQVEANLHERLIAWLDSQAAPRATPAAWETARIEAGVPEPVDLPEKTLPQELGRDARAISFTKGCYLGQETVARIDALGHVNRRFVAVAINDDRHSDGPRGADTSAVVRCGDEVVGRLTSVCFSPMLGCGLGLGLVQAKALDAARPLEVGGATASVVAVPLQAAHSRNLSDEPWRPDGQAEDVSPEDGEVLLVTRRFRVVRVTEPCTDGSRREREVVRHPGSVVIVPLVSAREVCLVEVVRVAVGKTLLELPAGTLDRVESLEEAARRELAEETGYRAGRIVSAGAMWMSPGILRERMHLFVAEDLVAGPQALEPGEQIRTRVVTWDEAIAMCLDGRIDDAKTIAGLLLTAARRR